MTQKLANILKNKLSEIDNGPAHEKGLIFIDKIAGLVAVAEKVNPTDVPGAFAVTKFPISVDVDYEQCISGGCYKDLVPNSKLKGILYFEDYGTRAKESTRSSYTYISKIRLICWINNKLIQGHECRSISHSLISEIRRALENGPFNAEGYTRINVKGTAVIGNDIRLFERYTYPSEAVKFLMHPYEAFGIDFDVEYTIPYHCLPDIYLSPQSC